MKNGTVRGLLVTGVAILAWMEPASALAKPGYFVEPGFRVSTFTLAASNGYRIQVAEVGRREVTLTASKKGQSASYSVHGKRAAADGIEATFPGLGRVSVEFQAAGKGHLETLLPGCKGRELVRPGVFRGTIRFHGEHGFTTLSAGRAKGDITEASREVCHFGPAKHGGHGFGDLHSSSLVAEHSTGNARVNLLATTLSSKSRPELDLAFFQATFFSRHDGMVVERDVDADADLTAFEADPAGSLDSATLSPPSPFIGTATFQRTPGVKPTLTGTLSVDFPGLGKVALAGQGFAPELCIDQHCAK